MLLEAIARLLEAYTLGFLNGEGNLGSWVDVASECYSLGKEGGSLVVTGSYGSWLGSS